MSATNRGGSRTPFDYYPTPGWAVRRLLEMIPPYNHYHDPCCGDGNILVEVQQRYPNKSLSGLDIQPRLVKSANHRLDSDDCRVGDFFEQSYSSHFGAVIMNPPFSLAQEFIEKAMDIAPVVYCLTRMSFLSSKCRHEFMRKHSPGVYVLPNRPSFTGGGTDAADYCWLEFGPRAGLIYHLDITPRAEITAANNRTRAIRKDLGV